MILVRSHAHVLFGISIFWMGLSMLGDGVNTLVLPKLLLDVGNESARATTLGLLTSVGLIGGMLLQPLAGAWSDRLRPRWGRRGVLGAGLVLMLASLLLLNARVDLVGISLAYLLLQVAVSVGQAAQQGFIPDQVSQSLRGTAAGLKGFMDLGGALLAFIVLGRLLGSNQFSLALVAIGAVILVSFALTLVLVPEARVHAPGNSERPSLRHMFQFDWHAHAQFARLVLARFLFLLGIYAVGRFFLFFIADRLALASDRASAEAGSLLAVLTLISVLCAIPAGWAADRFGRGRLMAVGAVLSAGGVLLLVVASSAAHILIFGGVLAVGSAAFTSANWAAVADLAPPDQAARFMGFANFGVAGAIAAAGLFGPLLDHLNGQAAGSGFSALFVFAAVALLASLGVVGVRTEERAAWPRSAAPGASAKR
jgi:MFS family permease